MGLGDLDRRILWVRAGGRCTLCRKYVLEGDLSSIEVPMGEGAHIVGQKDSTKSARGMNPMPVDQRDNVDNILLACSSCHTEIDKKKIEGLLDVTLLREVKRSHEADIKMQTGLLRSRRTAVIRMAGDIRGGVMELPRATAAEAVIRSAARFPFFLESYDRQGVEIDLRGIDGENPLETSYYPAATRRIDSALTNRVIPGVAQGDIEHLSIFAIARLPLLVYLGAMIDDGVPADIYQRHRATDSWKWPVTESSTEFTVTPPVSDDGGTDAVLITNLSGTTPVTDLPESLRSAPCWTIQPNTGPAEDVFQSTDVLTRFTETVRSFFTGLEASHKHVATVHLFGALPLAGALAFGRVLKSNGIRPTVVTYDREADSYQRALEI
ncbi:SAVED domain-containing protein [Prescottella equi]|uniref:SAVED domain-containing protein n=1 Tax=Rhodococcus hoagii TaxID=43767 RepID=UPI002574C9B1|nr:SAVED domain-containing protein [Prescottella equi]WJJ13952.1 SAVED domain-containing protein [Prescottella equi]